MTQGGGGNNARQAAREANVDLQAEVEVEEEVEGAGGGLMLVEGKASALCVVLSSTNTLLFLLYPNSPAVHTCRTNCLPTHFSGLP